MTTNNVFLMPAHLPEVGEVALFQLSPEEIASFQRQNPGLAHALGLPIAYDNGIEPVGLSGVGHG